MNCKHDRFECLASIGRITEGDNSVVVDYVANITVKCTQCGMPFEWVGVSVGVSFDKPMVSFDGKELRAPIKPSSDPVDQANQLLKIGKQ